MENNDSPFEYLATRLADDASPVTLMWQELAAEASWTARELWLNVFVDGEPTPLVVPIDDLPDEPDPSGVAGLMTMCERLVEQLGATSFAFLLARPSVGGPSDADLRWAVALVEAARDAGIPLETIHHANAAGVEPFRSDDLIGSR